MKNCIFEKYFSMMDKDPLHQDSVFIVLGFQRLLQIKGKSYMVKKIDQRLEFIFAHAEGHTFSNNIARDLMILWLEGKKFTSFDPNNQRRLLELLIKCLDSSYKEYKTYQTAARKILKNLPVSVIEKHFDYLVQIHKQGNINLQIIGELLEAFAKTGHLDKNNSIVEDILING